MPIYDYDCSSCGTRAEFIHGIDAPAPRFCPACGADGTLRKAFAPPVVHFKGSGWAKKDRSSAKTKASAAGGGDGADASRDPKAGDKAGDSSAAPGSTGGSTGDSKAAPSDGRSSSTATKSSTTGEG